MTNWEDLVTDDQLSEISKDRETKTIQKRVAEAAISSEEQSGWIVIKNYSNHDALMEKEKATGDSFEDEVWAIFYKMGFKLMNRDRDFHLQYSEGLTKQIDVVAIDDDVCLLIECKETASENNTHSWKTDLEAISGFRENLFAEIRSKYPNRRCKYVFATKNYVIGEQDSKRMQEFQIANFDYDTVQYYDQLVNHLGNAAKYQLLGNIFAKQTITQMEDRVPAIEGKMGGLTYYSFVIEPDRLLKIAYILHRNKANRRMMPTYQRLIKKERLKSIRGFVNNGGYFPNSLIVSIDTDGHDVRFEQSQARIEGETSRLGILYLPKKYQSVYVIDGQHRLYGYSETDWASKNSIPVVAFVDLPKKDQLKMFMDINQNQKPVSKSLRNTLNIDLLWDSDLYSRRLEALMLDIGQKLGEESKSPLYGLIVTGEDSVSGKRCITLDYIKEALKQTRFFNVYKKRKNEVAQLGTFDKMDNDDTFDLLFPFLEKSFQTVKDYCSQEWDKGPDGFVAINNCTYALIKIFDDIANVVLGKSGKQTVDDYNSFFKECEPLMLSLCDTINTLDAESINVIKTSKGGSAKKDSWRKLQVAFHTKCPEFNNDDLSKYIQENCVNNDQESGDLLTKIEGVFKTRIWVAMSDKDQWLNKYISESVSERLISKAAVENHRRETQGIVEKAKEWDYVSFEEMCDVVRFDSNWPTFCQSVFDSADGRMSKMEVLALLKDMATFKNKLTSAQHIVLSQYEEIRQTFQKFSSEANLRSQKVEVSSNGSNT
jgi:DNA sulfur modification protein DndB